MMKCQNPLCANPGLKEVAVSVNEPSDGRRTLCDACEAAYTWGIKHGRLASCRRQIEKDSEIQEWLDGYGFVVLTKNVTDPTPGLPFEAWAYEGPLDFAEARPVRFAVGAEYRQALGDLGMLITEPGACEDLYGGLTDRQKEIIRSKAIQSLISDMLSDRDNPRYWAEHLVRRWDIATCLEKLGLSLDDQVAQLGFNPQTGKSVN